MQKQSYVVGLYVSGNSSGFYAPARRAVQRRHQPAGRRSPIEGEPETPQMLRVGRELTNHHSIAGLSGVPAPLLVQNGWTDDLFPAPEALRVWRDVPQDARARA